jgi:mRNA-degrading endonuclease toxin of MazEF toxin-antitoxin module
MNQGDVCLTQFPFTDGSGWKPRPVLIASSDGYNGGQDVVVLPISSRPAPHDRFSILLDSQSRDFGPTGLRQTSSIKWTKPMAIAKSKITRRLGAVTTRTLGDVRHKLTDLFTA